MNRTVLVTGAALRIGNAIARRLGASGWNVVIHANRSVAQADVLCAELTAAGHRAWRVAGDLSSAGGPEAVFDAAVAQAGTLDALVNNASVFGRQSLASATSLDFERQWRVNTLAPILLTQRFAAHIAARHAAGCVVNLLDQRIAHVHAGAIPYLLSKKALEAFTLSAALELAPAVRVNAVAPGAVLPAVTDGAKEPAGAFPLGFRPSVDHVADAVAYLLEAPALTGQILHVDGGQHLAP